MTFVAIWEKHAVWSAGYHAESYHLLNELSLRFNLKELLGNLQIHDTAIKPIIAQSNEQALKEIFTYAQTDNVHPLTQTEAFLSKPRLRRLLSWYTRQFDLERILPLVKMAIFREREHRTDFVFYHGQMNLIMLYQDLRVPHIPQFDITLTRFLQEDAFDTDHEAPSSKRFFPLIWPFLLLL